MSRCKSVIWLAASVFVSRHVYLHLGQDGVSGLLLWHRLCFRSDAGPPQVHACLMVGYCYLQMTNPIWEKFLLSALFSSPDCPGWGWSLYRSLVLLFQANKEPFLNQFACVILGSIATPVCVYIICVFMWIHVFCLLSRVLNEFYTSHTWSELVHWYVSLHEKLVISR